MENTTEKPNHTIRAATPADLDTMAALTEMVFRDPFVRNVITKEEGFQYKNGRLLFDETGKLASTVFVIPREMYMDGLVLRLAGIGGVATDPVHRGKGYANFLMKDAVDFMEKEKYDMSVLYPFKAEYYAKFGYRIFTSAFSVIDTSKSVEAVPGVTVRQYADADIKQVMKVYEDFCSERTGPVKRKLSYWRDYIAKNSKVIEVILVAEKAGRIVAYAMMDKIRKDWSAPDHRLKLSEFGCLKGASDALNAIAARASVMAAEKGFKKLYVEGASGFDYGAAAAPTVEEAEEHKNLKYVKMYRIENFKSLIAKASPLWDKRLKKAGIKASISGLMEFKRAVVDYNASLEITMKKSGAKLSCDEGEFIRLFMGFDTLENANIQGKEALSAEEKEAIKAAWPLAKPVFWDFDYL